MTKFKNDPNAVPLKVHQACPTCGHKGCLSVYEDHTYCYSCNTSKPLSEYTEELPDDTLTKVEQEDLKDSKTPGKYRDIPDRRITEEVCRKYQVKTIQKEGRIVQHVYPYFNQNKELTGYKVRKVATKEFFLKGTLKNAGLFGQSLFPATGKIITVTEGELDCLSIYQMFDCKFPVVSLAAGAGSAARVVQEQYDYLNSFEEIRLCFDGDKPGRDAALKAAAILPPKKVKIVQFPEDMKDASEYLKAGKFKEFKDIYWRAEEYRPEDIANLADMFQETMDYTRSHKGIPTPWAGLNELIEGVGLGDLCIIAAGTGMGKSALMRSWMKYLVDSTDYNIGGIFLEEQAAQTSLSLLSLEVGADLKKQDVRETYSDKDLKKAFDSLSADRRIELIRRTERTDPDYIMERLRYLVKARECKVVFFDHISYTADASVNSTKEINKLCKDLKELCVSLDVAVIAAIHLRKSQGVKTHEEGGRVTLDDLKDSSAAKQLPDFVLAIERDSQSADPVISNTSALRVLKNRPFGTKGIATALSYDKDTTRLIEVDKSVLLGDEEDLTAI